MLLEISGLALYDAYNGMKIFLRYFFFWWLLGVVLMTQFNTHCSLLTLYKKKKKKTDKVTPFSSQVLESPSWLRTSDFRLAWSTVSAHCLGVVLIHPTLIFSYKILKKALFIGFERGRQVWTHFLFSKQMLSVQRIICQSRLNVSSLSDIETHDKYYIAYRLTDRRVLFSVQLS